MIAYRLYRAGKHKVQYPKVALDKPLFSYYGKVISPREITSYLDSRFYQALQDWSMYEYMGLPNGSQLGWANEPSWYIESVVAIQRAHVDAEREEQEERERQRSLDAAASRRRK